METMSEWTAATHPNRLLEILSEANYPIRELAVEVIRLKGEPSELRMVHGDDGIDDWRHGPDETNITHWFNGLLQPDCTDPLGDFKKVYKNHGFYDEHACQYIREAVNPFAPTIHPDWLTDTVKLFVVNMLEQNEFSAMPILADALQDAGCDNDDILNHCRHGEPHRRNCWVLALVTIQH